jgi:hypothetical protein
MIYIYQHKKHFIDVQTIKEAAQETHISTSTVTRYLREGLVTKRGFFFSYKKIPKDQLDKLPDSDKQISPKGLEYVSDGKCRKIVDNQEYEVSCKDGLVTYLPQKKEERKEALTKMIAKVAKDRWRNIPRSIATLERQFIRELLDSL